MASIQRVSLLASSVTVALVAALPAQAEDALTQPFKMAETTEAMSLSVEAEAINEGLEAAGSTGHLVTESDAIMLTEIENELSNDATAAEPVANEAIDVAAVETPAIALDESLSTSSATLFEGTEVAEAPAAAAGQEVAQVTRPLYRGVSPFYVGVAGNIGIIDSDESAIGDFGFNIISKVSLGPRFSIRPTLGFSEDDFNLAIPLTYNFNPIEVRDVSVYPSVGAGVDIADEVALLINGGIDIPISRDFTLNGQVNWRATSDVGLGVSLGVGYNFPFFFE